MANKTKWLYYALVVAIWGLAWFGAIQVIRLCARHHISLLLEFIGFCMCLGCGRLVSGLVTLLFIPASDPSFLPESTHAHDEESIFETDPHA